MNTLKKINSIVPFALLAFFVLGILESCKTESTPADDTMYGGDFSIIKKLEDSGGVYKFNGKPVDPLQLFANNGYNYGRMRLFHSPDMEGPVCNSLEYTIELSKRIKAAGMKLLLDIHYSDTWADPAHQIKPKAWEGLSFDVLTDSVYQYSKYVIEAMQKANVEPDMVQVGNEITPGFIWPDGQIYKDSTEDWTSFCTLLKAGIKGVEDAYSGRKVPIMIHIDRGGDLPKTQYFFDKISEQGVSFDLIGLSYYPWWHGTFNDLEENLTWLSENYTQDIVIVETAYHSNGYYPEPDKWVLDYQPFPPTEQGQYDYMVKLDSIVHQYPKAKGIFYWKPDGLEVPGSNVHYLGRSMFDKDGNGLKAITAFKK